MPVAYCGFFNLRFLRSSPSPSRSCSCPNSSASFLFRHSFTVTGRHLFCPSSAFTSPSCLLTPSPGVSCLLLHNGRWTSLIWTEITRWKYIWTFLMMRLDRFVNWLLSAPRNLLPSFFMRLSSDRFLAPPFQSTHSSHFIATDYSYCIVSLFTRTDTLDRHISKADGLLLFICTLILFSLWIRRHDTLMRALGRHNASMFLLLPPHHGVRSDTGSFNLPDPLRLLRRFRGGNPMVLLFLRSSGHRDTLWASWRRTSNKHSCPSLKTLLHSKFRPCTSPSTFQAFAAGILVFFCTVSLSWRILDVFSSSLSPWPVPTVFIFYLSNVTIICLIIALFLPKTLPALGSQSVIKNLSYATSIARVDELSNLKRVCFLLFHNNTFDVLPSDLYQIFNSFDFPIAS